MPVGGSPQAIERLGIIMKFLDAEFVQGFIRMADDGWHHSSRTGRRVFPGDRQWQIFS